MAEGLPPIPRLNPRREPVAATPAAAPAPPGMKVIGRAPPGMKVVGPVAPPAPTVSGFDLENQRRKEAGLPLLKPAPAPAMAAPETPPAAPPGMKVIGPKPATAGDYLKEGGKGIVRGVGTMAETAIKAAPGAVSAVREATKASIAEDLAMLDRIERGEPAQPWNPSNRSLGIPGDAADRYRAMTPEQRATERKRLTDYLAAYVPMDIEKNPIYVAGQQLGKDVREAFPAAPGWEDSITSTLTEGLGTVAAGVGAYAAGGPLFAGTLFTAGGAGEALDRALAWDKAEKAAGRPGATPGQIATATIFGTVAGATDLAPIETALGVLKIPTPFRSAIAKAIARVGGQALVEGGQEGAQQIIQNAISQTYNENQQLFEGVAPNVAAGAGIGAITEALFEVAMPGRHKGGGHSDPAADMQRAQTEADKAGPGVTITINGQTAAGRAPGAAPPPPPMAGPQPIATPAPTPPAVTTPAPAPTATPPAPPPAAAPDEDAAILRAAGWSDDDIAAMGDEERADEVQSARDAGVTAPAPTAAPPAPQAPPPQPTAPAPESPPDVVQQVPEPPPPEREAEVLPGVPSGVSTPVAPGETGGVSGASTDVSGEAAPAADVDAQHSAPASDAVDDGLDAAFDDELAKTGAAAPPDATLVTAADLAAAAPETPPAPAPRAQATVADWIAASPDKKRSPKKRQAHLHTLTVGMINAEEDPATLRRLKRALADYAPPQAERKHSHWALNTRAVNARLREIANAGKTIPQRMAELQAKGKPHDVISFIKSIGGIQQSTELKMMDAHRRPGLVNKKGKPADMVREALAEAGFFGGDAEEDVAGTSLSDLYDLIDRSLRGEKIHAPQDQARADELAAKARDERGRDEAEARVYEAIEEYGFELDADQVESAVNLTLSGQSPTDAVEIVVMKAMEDGVAPPDDAIFDEYPDWEWPSDEELAATVAQDGGLAGPEGEDGNGPGEEDGDSEAVPQRPPARAGGDGRGKPGTVERFTLDELFSPPERARLAKVDKADGIAAEMLRELRLVGRRVAAEMNRKGLTLDQWGADGRGADAQQAQQEAGLLAEIVELTGEISAEAGGGRDIAPPDIDEETGEAEGNGLASRIRQFLENFEAQGIPLEMGPATDAYARGTASAGTMPAEEIFPPPGKTVNFDTKLGKNFVTVDQAVEAIDSWKAAAKKVGQERDNSRKVVISLFDYTGTWSQPWRDAGYTVVQHDIKTSGDVLIDDWIWNQVEEMRDSGLEVVGVMSACPCTTYAVSGARWWESLHDAESEDAVRKVFGDRGVASGAKSPKEYNNMLAQATKDMVRVANPSRFHVLENPIGRIKAEAKLPDPTVRFQPNNFGDPYTKQTQLFGAFDTAMPTANVRPIDGSKIHQIRGDSALGKMERSITPTGFAYAFFMANDPDAKGFLNAPVEETAAPAPPPREEPAPAPEEDAAPADDGLDAAFDDEVKATETPAAKPKKVVTRKKPETPPGNVTIAEAAAWMNPRLPPGYVMDASGDSLTVRGPDGYERSSFSGSSLLESIDLKDALADARKDAAASGGAKVKAAATSAVKNTGAGLKDVMAGIDALINPKGKLGMGPSFDDDTYRAMIPHLKAGVAHFAEAGRDIVEMVRELVRYFRAQGKSTEWINAVKPYTLQFARDVRDGKESLDAPSERDDLESDRGDGAAGDDVGGANVPAPSGADGQGAGARGSAPRGGRGGSGRGSVPQGHAPAVGEGGNLELPERAPGDRGGTPAAGDGDGGRTDGGEGLQSDHPAEKAVVGPTQGRASIEEKRTAQAAAEKIAHAPGLANINATLPFLYPEQREDIHKAEQRFETAHGMMFTHGTGTGKSYLSLGTAKRFNKAGKKNILIVVPSQGLITDLEKKARDLFLPTYRLASTSEAGPDATVILTTYANFQSNPSLAKREWDLIITDETQKLSSDKDGTITEALEALRALTQHPRGFEARARMTLPSLWSRVEQLAPKKRETPSEKYFEAYAAYREKADPLIAQWRAEPRTTKVLMLSATPFAHHFSLDYAEGFIFDYGPDPKSGGYNTPGAREAWYMQHLGYRMRYNKLTRPDVDVQSDVMERQLHETLKASGALTGRRLDVPFDYDRKFVLIDDPVGSKIDDLLTFTQEADDGYFRPLNDEIGKQFDYLRRMRLLEAIKAKAVIPHIRESWALGRKVVVFHNFNEGGGFNPFELVIDPKKKVTTTVAGERKEVLLKDIYDEFHRRRPDARRLEFKDYLAPIAELQREFGDDALIYNGKVPNKKRDANKATFNTDGPEGGKLIVVQADAGEFGISLHDTTGDAQRVIYNLGIPVKPTTAIQEEGRIYRDGQQSDAMFRYLNTGTNWERWTFAGRMAERSGTAENLGLGNLSRALRIAFVDAYNDSGPYHPEPGEGKGGKDNDRALAVEISEFEKAKTHYFAQGKKSGRRDQREGIDYFPTPEPLGLKMVEWAGLRPGEHILEPSGGHGAISRYFPDDAHRTVVEPSSELASRAALVTPGARVLVARFEDLHVSNKYDAIVMNPPFGVGGKTAVEHLAKAFTHLANGGRIVALIPRGPAATERFVAWQQKTKGLHIVGDVYLPTVTFERAGTSVAARVVLIEKNTDVQHIGGPNIDITDEDAPNIRDLFDRIENLSFGPRHAVETKEVIAAPPKAADAAAEVASTEAPAAPADEAPTGITFSTRDTKHTRTGAPLFLASMTKKVSGETYSKVSAVVKRHNGYWSRFDRAFSFDAADDRAAFLAEMAGGGSPAAAVARSAAEIRETSDALAEVMRLTNDKGTFDAQIAAIEAWPVADVIALSREFSGRGSTSKAEAIRHMRARKIAFDVSRDKAKATDGRVAFAMAPAAPRTSSPAFKAWFGDSKVVNDDGSPMVVYHGTRDDFDVFDAEQTRDKGFHFGSAAQANMRQGRGALMPVYLKIENPRRSKDLGGWWSQKIESAKAAGHDGIVYLNRYEGITLEEINAAREKAKGRDIDNLTDAQFRRLVPSARDSYIAFEPTQIKSVANPGTFDARNLSIMAAAGVDRVDLFDGPAEQTVIPGAEQITREELARRQAAKELADRQAQARIAPKKPQKQADEGLFGDGHKQGSLFAKGRGPASGRVEFSSPGIPQVNVPAEATERLKADMNAIIERIAGPGVRVEFFSRIDAKALDHIGALAESAYEESSEFYGLYFPSDANGAGDRRTINGQPVVAAEPLIFLSLSSPDPRTYAGHEAWHHVRTDLLTDREKAILDADLARPDSTMRRLAIAERESAAGYPDLEIEAFAFQRHRRLREEGMSGAPIHIAIRRMFDRIIAILRDIKAALTGRGYGSVEAIFQAAERGKLATRRETSTVDAIFAARASKAQADFFDILAQRASDPTYDRDAREAELMAKLFAEEEAGGPLPPMMQVTYTVPGDGTYRSMYGYATTRDGVQGFATGPGGLFVPMTQIGQVRQIEEKARADLEAHFRDLKEMRDYAANYDGPQFAIAPATASSAFKRWFGSSKVVRADGSPKVMYHGARESFDSFDPAKSNKEALYGPGFYFTDSAQVASGLDTPGRPQEIPRDFQDIEWRAAFNMAGYAWQGSRYTLDGEFTPRKLYHLERMLDSNEYIRFLRENGADHTIGRPRAEAHRLIKAIRAGEQRADELRSLVAQELPRWMVDRLGFLKYPTTKPQTYPVYLSITNPFEIDVGANDSRYFAMVREMGSKEAVNAHLATQGYDGIHHTGGKNVGTMGEHDVWIAFEPAQIKSIANAGGFDPSNPSIMAARAPTPAPTTPSPAGWKPGTAAWGTPAPAAQAPASPAPAPSPTNPPPMTPMRARIERSLMRVSAFSDRTRRALQDQDIYIRRLQEQIEKVLGPLPEALDVYLSSTLYSGRAGERMIDLRERRLDALIEKMRGPQGPGIDVTREALDEYLYALHAKERNAFIASNRDPSNVEGSGMTDQEADAIINRVHGGPQAALFQELSRDVQAIVRETRMTLLRAGLIDRDTFDELEAQYQNYVPLRGWEAEESDDGPNVGQGYSTRGKEWKAAMGRRTRADSPLAYVMLQAQQAIIRSEKNRVGKSVLRLVNSYPNPAIWKVTPGKMVKVLDKRTGMVRRVWQHPSADWANKKLFGVKLGGKQVFIEIEHEDFRRAVLKIGSAGVGMDNAIVRFISRIARLFSAMRTQFDPEFIMSNFFRDLDTAMINVGDVKGRPKWIRLKALKITLKNVKEIFLALRDPTRNNEITRYWEEYRLGGGKVSFLEWNNVSDIKRNIEKQARRGDYSGFFRSIGKLVSDMNTAVENAVRLAVYINLRKGGMTVDRSAFEAKELTVNFNRHGEFGPLVNMLYVFANASIQGTFRMGRALVRSKTVRRVALGLMAYGAVQNLINSLLSDDDDQGKNLFDQMKYYERERNFIFMLPGTDGVAFTKPAAYGWNLPMMLGDQMMAVARGAVSPEEAIANIGGTAMSSFNPLGSAGSFLQMLTPSLFDPLIQQSEGDRGLTWYGGPLYPKKYDERKPDSENFGPTTPQWAVDAARDLNKLFGGNVGKKSTFMGIDTDITPAVIELWANHLGGGVSRFASNAWETTRGAFTDEEVPNENVPFWRRLVKDTNARPQLWNKFYEAWDRADAAQYEVDQLYKAGQEDDAARSERRNEADILLYDDLKPIKARLDKMRSERKKIESDRDLTPEARKAELDAIAEEEKELLIEALGYVP